MKRGIAFVWDNFGPLHVDRCNAVAKELAESTVYGIELFARSRLYDWDQPEATQFDKVTLFAEGGWDSVGSVKLGQAIAKAVLERDCRAVFLAHYDQLAILYAAIRLRAKGVAVFTMGCSKFDDAPRKGWREWVKRQFLKPYRGAIGSHYRSTDYWKFLGLTEDRIFGGYNTVDQARIRALAAVGGLGKPAFTDRPFLAVARLILEKNLPGLLRAYADYRQQVDNPRRLVIAGSGPLESALKAQAEELGVAEHVDWPGFVQTAQVASLMRDAVCLCLPSVSETFGNVVPEALAVDLPVLISAQCGAADRLVENGKNGFIFAPGDHDALVDAMIEIGRDEEQWRQFRARSAELAPLGDTRQFAASVRALAG